MFNEIRVLDCESLSSTSTRFKQDLPKIKELTQFPLYFRAIKPWAILSALESKTRNFDVVVYLDAGCELPNNWVARRRLTKLMLFSINQGSIAEQTLYPEYRYSRKSLLNKFGNESTLNNSGQVQSTWSMFKNSESNVKFMLEWIELSNPKYNFWQDPNELELKEEHAEFIENRWDQSIFSLLYKSHSLPLKNTYWEYGGKFGRIRGLAIPIHATRNKTGTSKLPRFHTNNFLALLAVFLNFLFDKSRFLR